MSGSAPLETGELPQAPADSWRADRTDLLPPAADSQRQPRQQRPTMVDLDSRSATAAKGHDADRADAGRDPGSTANDVRSADSRGEDLGERSSHDWRSDDWRPVDRREVPRRTRDEPDLPTGYGPDPLDTGRPARLLEAGRAAGAARALLDQPASPGLRRPPTRPDEQPAVRPRPADFGTVPGQAGSGNDADGRPDARDVAHGLAGAGADVASARPATVSTPPEGRSGSALAGVGPAPAGDATRRDEDDEPTEPLPVILPRGTGVPRPVVEEARPRGPFEPARPHRPAADAGTTAHVVPSPSGASNGLASSTAASHDAVLEDAVSRDAVGQDAAQPASRSPSGSHLPPPPDEPLRNEPPPVNPRLESLKDLYFTAAAIGEEALDKHFEVVSRRQRELIQEYFDKAPKSDAGA